MGLLRSYHASTLIEVIVALVISSLLLVLGSMLFDSLWSSGKSEMEMKAEALANAALADPRAFEMADTTQMVKLVLSETPYPASPGTNLLRVVVLSPGGDTLYEARRFARKP